MSFDLAPDEDFVDIVHIPGSKPSRFRVEIRRFNGPQDQHLVTQVSEPLGRREANRLAGIWSDFHHLEIKG